MHRLQRALFWIMVVGGAVVLGSYAWGFLAHPEASRALWGGVPASLRPVYTANMLLSAAGFFAFAHLLLLRVKPGVVSVAGRLGFPVFLPIFAGILLPSAAWMPLTVAMVEAPSNAIWIATRVTLAVVGAASLALAVALLALRPARRDWAFWLALAGALFFTLQTAVLDAIIWPAYFHV